MSHTRTTVCCSLLLFFLVTIASYGQQYRSYDELQSYLNGLVREHSDKASLASIATTGEGRAVQVVTIVSSQVDRHPALLIVGGAVGSHLAGTELTVRFIENILSDRSDSIAELLNRVTFYVIPQANPDASAQYHAPLKYERNSNARLTDDDRDGETNEDGFEDLNSDGLITMIRVRSSGGTHVVDSIDPRIMIPANFAQGVRGTYDLYTEGIDNDGDGEFNEDGEGGVDFNRNFTYSYPYFKPGAGPHQVSEPETRAIADFCYEHQNIAAVFSFSPQNNLYHPWQVKKGEGESRIITSVRPDDESAMQHIAKIFGEVTGFESAPEYEPGTGSFTEWAYYHIGRWSFGANGWWMPKPEAKPAESNRDTTSITPDKGQNKKGDESPDREALQWLEEYGITTGFVNWREIDHPDFPGKTVEVGGFAPFVRTNPPANMLDSLGGKHAAFLKRLGGMLPQLIKDDLTVEPLGNGVNRITLRVMNTGYLPTISAMGQQSRVPQNVKVELTLASQQTLSAGRRVQLLEPVRGSGGTEELSWVIVGTGKVKIEVYGPMAGGFTETVELR